MSAASRVEAQGAFTAWEQPALPAGKRPPRSIPPPELPSMFLTEDQAFTALTQSNSAALPFELGSGQGSHSEREGNNRG